MFRTVTLNLKNIIYSSVRLKSTSPGTHVAKQLNNHLLEKVLKEAGGTGKTFEVLNPLNRSLLAHVVDHDETHVNDAISKAHDSLPAWKKLPAKTRSSMMYKLHSLLMQHKQQLAEIITLENGKSLKDAYGEVVNGSDFVEWFAEEGRRVYGDLVAPTTNDRRCIISKEPVGVCSMITPWNFPFAMAARKVAPALVAGCTVVLKASEETPLSSYAISVLMREAGFPEGVLSVVTCRASKVASVGALLCTHPSIQKVSFTGSTDVGKTILKLASGTVKKASMELGGNAPFIVFPSASLPAAAAALMAGKFRCSGQTCISPNRVFVHEDVHDSFVGELRKLMGQHLRMGNGLLATTTQGPLINSAAVEKVIGHVTDATSKGARVLEGGRGRGWKDGEGVVDGGEGACFMEPTLLSDVSSDSLCFQQETFGPLIPVTKFSNENEVIDLANSCTSGLAGYFFSNDQSQVWRVSEALEVGMVASNLGVLGLVQMPFGGVKESGFGKEGSKYGLEDYLVYKAIHMGLDLN